MRNKLRRPLAFLLSAVMIVTMSGTPVHAVADRGQPETGLCEHHAAHTDECGYTESTPGTPCTYVCEICNPQDSGEADEEPETGIIKQEQCSCLTLCTEGQINPDCPVCGAEDVRERFDKILSLFSELTEDEQEQIDLSRCYELQGALDVANDPAPITESVEYQEASWDGSQVTYESKTETCTLVENSAEAVTWTTGWYAVSGTVTISEPITVNGEVHLILTDGCTLTAEKGIVVTSTNSLTIYAQSEDGGTLNATGTADDSGNASAGIGGSTSSFDSGSITIHGGVINATSGASRWYSGAGIGGSTPSSGNGGNSGAIKIYGGTITAESTGYTTGAGIGGGGSGGTGDGGAGTNIIIYGGSITATSHSTGNGGAGIGGGSGQQNGGTGDAIAIHGGVVRATGGSLGAGIGGGGGSKKSGDGTVTISGGTVTAVGGSNAAGIGGGGGYSGDYGMNITGGTGSVTITGGIVDATENGGGASIGNGGNTTAAATVSKTNAIVFENGAGTVCGDVTLNGSYPVPADYTLNIPAGASLSGSGTLTGGGTFTADLSEDMVSVPTDLYYNGHDRSNDIKTRLSDGLTQGIVICGQTFTFSGWSVEVSRTDDSHYTATYTNTDNSTTFQKTITLQQSGTTLDGAVKTYNSDTQTTTFTASDTITVKATPTATGEAPANSAMFAASFTGPGAGQMAVFVGDTQVSAPADKGADGTYTMTVSAADVLAAAGGPGTGITLTAKFVGNDNMADGAGTVDVSISAVAKIENGSSTTYVGNLADAFTEGNSGATVTLLSEVDLGSNYISIRESNTFTLDLNGQTVKASYYDAFDISGGSLTIQDSGTGGKIESSDITIEVTGGTLSIQSGTVSGHTGVQISSGAVNISGGTISGSDTGLKVTGGGNIAISGGTFSGVIAVEIHSNASVTLKDLLAAGYAYHQNDIPVANAEGPGGEVPLDAKPAWLPGTVTVKKCNHTGEGVCEYTPNEGAETHAMTCLACGYAGAAESCAYSDDYGHDETNHWQTCTLCGGKKTEAHGWVHQCTSATGIIRRSCDKCEIETVVGTVSITPDFSVTYGKTGSATLVCTAELADGYSLEPADSADNCWVLMALSDGKSWNLGRELEVKLPADLPAGEYWYDAYPRLSYQGNNTIVKRFNVIGKVTVTPAPLTVTGAAAKDRTYDGTNSVQITGVTLDGVLNSDNVSVDLTGLTGTLSGSDAETYTSVTLPRLTLTGGAASNYTLPQSMGAVPASVTISKATLTATGATVASKTYDGNTAASVSSVTFTGLVPGEALALGTDYTATGTFADANAGTGKSVSIAVTLKDSAKANNYNLTNGSVNATGTIAKASQTAPSITGLPTGTITYGDSFTLHTEGGVSWSASGAATVDSSGKVTVTGTGKVTITATKPGDNNHYSAEDQITFTAVPKVLAVTGLTVTDRAYDGTSTVEITGVTLAGILNGDDVSVATTGLTGTLNGSDVGTYTAVTLPRLTLTGGAASNYILSQLPGAVPASVTIRKAAPLTPKTGDLAVANKQAHTYTYGLGALRPDVPEGMSLGSTAVTYELGPVNLGSYYDSGAMIDGQTLTLPIKAVESDEEIGIGTITVIIHTQNFEDMTATINVRSENKIIPTDVSLNKTSMTLTVGGSERLTATVAPDNATNKAVTWASSNTAVVTVDASGNVTAVSVGKATITATTVDGGKTASCTVTVKQNTPPPPARYTVTVEAGPGGRVSGGGTYTRGTPVTVKAIADSGYHFVRWTENGKEVDANASYTFTVTGRRTLTAVFEKDEDPTPPAPDKYTVTAEAGPGGRVTGSGTYEENASVTVTATPESGYHFVEWTEDGSAVSTEESYTFTVTGDRTLTAVFEKDEDPTPPEPVQYTVTAEAGPGGRVTGGGTYEENASVTVTATADSGYHFVEWTEDGSAVSTEASYTFTVTGDRTLTAVFEKDEDPTPPEPVQFTVTVEAGPGGTVSGGGTYEENATVTVTATPESGYHFVRWTENGGKVSGEIRYTFTVTSDRTLTAVFERNSSSGGGSGGSSGGGSSGGGSSSGGPAAGGGATVVERPDPARPGIPTVSQTKPVTPDKNGNVTISNGAVQSAINTAKNDAKKNGNTANGVAVVIPIAPGAGQDAFNVAIQAQTLNTLVRENVKRLEMDIQGVLVETMDAGLLQWLDTALANGDIILRVTPPSGLSQAARAAIGTRPVYDLSLVHLSGGKETPITDLGGRTIAVRLPYAPAKEEQTENLYAVYVDGKGQVEWLTKSSYDPDLGAVVFETGHFSIYGIGYKNPVPAFTDIQNHWAEDNIIFAASRGLLTGTGNNQFSPDTGMTRGMFVTALGRLAGIEPDSYKTGKFTDVKADAYYVPYVNWAAEKGIVNGTASTAFSPDTNITREQMAVIMAGYAKQLGYDLPAAHDAVTFADNAQISGWAAKEVKAMQQAGIMAGKGGSRFDPKGTATRAEVATVLRRFVEIVIDPQTAQGWMQNHSGSWQYMKK